MGHICSEPSYLRVQPDAGQWSFTGKIQDSGRFDRDCAWCKTQNLRIVFEVRDAVPNEIMLVCETCLGSGSVHIKHENKVLQGRERRDHLRRLSVRLMHRTCRDVIRNLVASSDDPTLREVAVYFDRNGQLSPSRAAAVALALSGSQLDADAQIFEIQIRSIVHQQEFGGLSEHEKLAVWPVLSPAFQAQLISLGFAPEQLASRPANAGVSHATLQASV